MRRDGGFGIVAVMAGAVVLGIFALSYTQQMQNRANISLIGDLMSFREQVITYYSAMVSNRNTWECTVKSSAELSSYVNDPTFKPNLPVCAPNCPSGHYYPGVNAGIPLAIYDYTGDCQEGFGPGTTGTLRIPIEGLGLMLQDYNDLPIAAVQCDPDVHHLCLTVEWEALDPDHHSWRKKRRGVEVKLMLKSYRKNIKNDLNVSFELADKEHAIYMNRMVATDCSDGRLTYHFLGSKGVAAYAGDTNITKLDDVQGYVGCSHRGPLIIPPCYDMDDYEYINAASATAKDATGMVNPFLSGTGMPGYRGLRTAHGFYGIRRGKYMACKTSTTHGVAPLIPSREAIKGRCPETPGSGTTAIAYFDRHTGISHCSNPNILVEKVDETETSKNCDENNQYGVIRIRASDDPGGKVGTFECSTKRWGTGTGGVEPGKGNCTTTQALAGFHLTDGRITSCAESSNTDNPIGFPGPQGEKGDDGLWRYNKGYRAPKGPPGRPGPVRSCGHLSNATRSCWAC